MRGDATLGPLTLDIIMKEGRPQSVCVVVLVFSLLFFCPHNDYCFGLCTNRFLQFRKQFSFRNQSCLSQIDCHFAHAIPTFPSDILMIFSCPGRVNIRCTGTKLPPNWWRVVTPFENSNQNGLACLFRSIFVSFIRRQLFISRLR